MCDPRQGSILTGQPRGTICRVTCTLRRYLPACQPAYQVHRRERDLPQPLAHALSHSHSSTRTTHTTCTQAYHTHTPRQDGTGRTQDLASSHLSAAERSVHQVEQSGARTARSWNKHTPLPQLPSPPPLRGQIRSIARLSSSLMARSLSVARSLVHCTWPRWPRRPSLMLQPAASNGPPRYHFPRLFPVGNTQAEWMPRPKSHPNLGNSAPFLQSKRLNIQLTTSDAPFHLGMLLALILHLLYESHLSPTGPRTITSSSWPRS